MSAVRSLCDRASISGISSRNFTHSGIFNAMPVRPGRSTACLLIPLPHIDAADAGRYADEHISADVYFKIDVFLCGGLVDRLVDFPNLRFKPGPTFQR